MAGYVTASPAFVRGKPKPGRRAVFVIFEKLPHDFTAFFSNLTQAVPCVLDVLDKEY